ncbi:uncharacterized protein F5891DRAFT_223255 [Suillus fuscotomentosus]|uniref:DUF6533 domain-containing protein n=1 Tax=Suillus fuscotomentosus TaxID=1912939 RepID=A0AAD4HTF1_9AGAM|nr:uncharacterized protein F5891DRAFT_223255 [Suillus fuscotomentosus]KAG1908022.1 hypothetical protein F5891DRAFT_223255 [Suillus fuscotomentosus]
MTITVSINDPAWWPIIKAYRLASYFMVAAFIGVTYDWALTFAQEVELIWRRRWSLMTVLYLSVRYLGILYAALSIPNSVPTISLTDTVSLLHRYVVIPFQLTAIPCSSGCFIIYIVENWTAVLVVAMLSVIIIIRLHAMYQRSRKILIFLIVTFLANNIFDGVVATKITMHSSGEELIAFGVDLCRINSARDIVLLISLTWILCTVWEVVTLCLAVCVAVKHFRELRRHSAGGMIGDCFKVLMKSHVVFSSS